MLQNIFNQTWSDLYLYLTLKTVVANEFLNDNKSEGSETVGVLSGNTNEK